MTQLRFGDAGIAGKGKTSKERFFPRWSKSFRGILSDCRQFACKRT
jgi:hypothetical protein